MNADMIITPLDCIEKIHKISENSLLREPLFEAVADEIRRLSQYLNATPIETVLFANAFAMWFDRNNFSTVFNHLGLKEFQILKYRKEITSLYSKKLLINKDKTERNINDFDITQTILIAISDNLPVQISKQNTDSCQKKNLVDILEGFYEISEQYDDEKIMSFEFKDYIDKLCVTYSNYPLFKEIKKLRLDNFETFFLLDTIWDAISAGDNEYNTGLQRTVNDYFKRKSSAIQALNQFLKGENKLIKKGLVELSKEGFANHVLVKLSDYMIDFLHKNEELTIDNISVDNKKLILHKDLPPRKLFYNTEEKIQIERISEILSEKRFHSLQLSLKQKNMPSGIAILFHGTAGTGKTESVYQLAKQTNRNIFKVDISDTKSKWFGESQKIIKKVFTDYKAFCKTEKTTPFLLLNEADAVIGKRKMAGSTNTADTENAIQNIILEEIENFEGIMFATTNMVENMDAAFERRFLFKIRFNSPEEYCAAKIWRLKFPSMTEDESIKLATDFNFSGGEMENIARKCLMDELLAGTKPTFNHIYQLCKNEKWSDSSGKTQIGFLSKAISGLKNIQEPTTRQ
ncbi:ATP-binding protein [Chryseobacterium sp. HSC-36S06]|uniref:ATP-binding protein n=1 Tax=Chryseobacterium sp. HSC-36S06 TaxID=2910970 RepID=UPI00209CFB52|nr:ATP-binding protein [Chryseobacterium sp. HSC-36S06]MCP2038159.1 hypothetical protein [Chryseobacterium sp. HSC-36S06]